MFFEGSLGDGITTALQEKKLVACFITDEKEESSKWELWMKSDNDLSAKLSSSAVLLRLIAGGQEAGYLAAFCPVDNPPMLIVISNGVPTAHLKVGLTEAEFKDALSDALGNTASSHTRDPAIQPGGENIQDSSTLTSSASQPTTSRPANAKPSQTKAMPTADSSSTTKPQPSSIPDDSKVKEKEAKAKKAAEYKKNESDARAERRRVLAQIESDKKERQARERDRKAAQREEAEQAGQAAQELKQNTSSKRRNHKECGLKIRTFDGSTISSTFPSEQTLAQHVRPWIDSTLGALEVPFEFKQVLAPMPNRRISPSEEEESLVIMGLAPNALLVMVPVQGFSTAYSESSQGVVGSTLSYGYGLVSSGVGLAGSLVGSLFGRASEPAKQKDNEDAAEGPNTSNISNIRVRTLADQRRGQDDQQLYNGNQLNFERRKNEDEDDKE